MALIGLRMVSGALSADFNYLYPVCVVGVAAALVWGRRSYGRWDGSCSWTAPAIGLAVYALWIALEPTGSASWATGRHMPLALQTLPAHWALGWIAFRVVGSVVTVPLAEELAFRGFLIRRMQAADFESVPLGRFSWLSLLGSSLLFGLLHGRWVAGTLAGMLFAFALYRRRRLCDAVVAHATSNALIAAHVLVGGSWNLWA
jgi:CAAX prenyl protease-like protein